MFIESLNKSLAEQKRLEKMKNQFLSVTSHELRTPITPMKAQIQMIIGEYFGPVSKEQKDSLSLVLKNTERLDSLITDILDISKMQSGTLKFSFQKTDMNELISNAFETMKQKALQKI